MYDVPIEWVTASDETARSYVIWRVLWREGRTQGDWTLLGETGSQVSVVCEVQRRNIAAQRTALAYRYRALPVGVSP